MQSHPCHGAMRDMLSGHPYGHLYDIISSDIIRAEVRMSDHTISRSDYGIMKRKARIYYAANQRINQTIFWHVQHGMRLLFLL